MVVLNTAEESSTRATLQIEVPAEDVDKAFRSVRRAYAKRAAIPGFRKGHAPEAVVEKRFSGEIREDVLERVLPEALASAVEEKKLAVLGRPRIEELSWEPPGPIRFTARLDLRPAVDPGPHRGIPVHDFPVEPTEEEIARIVDRIREGHAEFHPLEGRPAAAGDFAVVDVAGTFIEILQPGQNPRTFRDEKLTLEVGHVDSMPEINDALRGAVPGETRRFRKSFPDEFPNEQFRGKTVDYAVTLVALKEKKLPEFNDELARMVGENETAAGLREKVAQGVRHDKQVERRRRMRREILDVLLSRTNIPAPEVLVDAEVHAALRDYARYLEASGANPQEADWAKLREDARPGAERRVREYLVLDEIARREQVTVSETELDAEIKRAAARRGVEAGQLREQMAAADGLEALRDEIRLGKTVDLLISAAQVLPAAEGDRT